MFSAGRASFVERVVSRITVLILAVTVSGCASAVTGSPAGSSNTRLAESATPAVSQGAAFAQHGISDTQVPSSATPRCAWAVVNSPSGSGGSNLSCVAAASATDVWVVGASNTRVSENGGSFSPRALLEHFNGKRWSIVSGPSGPARHSDLTAVSVTPDGTVWAVGWGIGSRGRYFTVIEHYNGKQWSVARAPHPPQATLSGVAALSSHHVWAVGSSDKVGLFAEHYNGKMWSLSRSSYTAMPGQVNVLDNAPAAISAPSSNDIWIVGKYLGVGHNFGPHTLTEQYNGNTWALVKSPDPFDTKAGALMAVAARAADGAWAVGLDDAASRTKSTGWVSRPLVERYDGKRWGIMTTPHVRDVPWSVSLTGVASVSTNDVWAVGSVQDRSLIEHYNGKTWQIVNTPLPQPINSLAAITAISSQNLWAVGSGPKGTLIEHCSAAHAPTGSAN